jgi:hypothetical protein
MLSFGAAATSRLLALLVDQIGKNRPDEVAAALRASADSAEDLGFLAWKRIYGDGRINVAGVIASDEPYADVPLVLSLDERRAHRFEDGSGADRRQTHENRWAGAANS